MFCPGAEGTDLPHRQQTWLVWSELVTQFFVTFLLQKKVQRSCSSRVFFIVVKKLTAKHFQCSCLKSYFCIYTKACTQPEF